jgi:hypothetical protein
MRALNDPTLFKTRRRKKRFWKQLYLIANGNSRFELSTDLFLGFKSEAAVRARPKIEDKLLLAKMFYKLRSHHRAAAFTTDRFAFGATD